jgi:hypothetical protein
MVIYVYSARLEVIKGRYVTDSRFQFSSFVSESSFGICKELIGPS